MTSNTIGMYFPTGSVLHKLDARVKIILIAAVIVSMFICKNFFSLILVTVFSFALVVIGKIPLKSVLRSVKPLAFIILLTAILNLFYGSGKVLLRLGKLKITDGGVHTAVFMAIRIILLIIIGSMLTYTTTPTDLTDALERLFKPLTFLKVDVSSIAMTMTIALRFIPTLTDEINKIMNAQKSRGADMESGNFVKRLKAMIPVLIPLFVSSFRRANDLAYAMDCRCYQGGAGRTKMKQVKITYRDGIAAFVVAAVYAGIIILNKMGASVI